MELTFDINNDDWNRLERPEMLVRAAALAAFDAAGIAADDIELSVVLADDEFVAGLNQRWRAKQGATNVLSFPVGQDIARGEGEPRFIGDIVLASGVVNYQSIEFGKPLATHVSHLVVHGVMHLLGYDHQDDESTDRMQAIETAALALLDMPDPYLEHEETAAAG